MKIGDNKDSIRELSSFEGNMRQRVLDIARKQQLDVGHVLSPNMLMSLVTKLNPKEKDELFNAIEELIKEGVFEKKNDKTCLTEIGRDTLY